MTNGNNHLIFTRKYFSVRMVRVLLPVSHRFWRLNRIITTTTTTTTTRTISSRRGNDDARYRAGASYQIRVRPSERSAAASGVAVHGQCTCYERLLFGTFIEVADSAFRAKSKILRTADGLIAGSSPDVIPRRIRVWPSVHAAITCGA